ncbi:MAG: molybdate ABC transporter permease subunit [Thiotrichales bacterium]|jgi:molybdate transport system permease protein|nr:molybdate ABC transporter permease subunit [Thiotrichales bacterium]
MFDITSDDLSAIILTLKLAGLTTLILLSIAAPLAWWLANGKSLGRVVVQALVALPLVLPPTVLGFYMLMMLGPKGAIGGQLESWGWHHLAFTFEGLVVSSVLYSMPFAVQPLQETFSNLGRRPIEVAAAMGANAIDRFFTVILPLCKGGFAIAATLTFAHTIGEFGVILMVGGNIPGETHVLSTVIYDYAESMNYEAAHRLSFILLIFAFAVLFTVYALNKRFETVKL